MMEQEMAQSKEVIEQRKRTCLIASLVGSLQIDEAMEAKKRDEDKKGMFLIIGYNIIKKCIISSVFRSFTS